MLTRELAVARYERGRVIPDRLTRLSHAHYMQYADEMIRIYSAGIGQTRRSLHQEVRHIFQTEENCPTRRIDAFCKLLDEWSVYDQDRKRQSAKMRIATFRAAAPFHPLVQTADRWFEHRQDTAKESIAQLQGMTWPDLESRLFSDLVEFQKLQSFTPPDDPAQLLSRYNVAQVQVALFDAKKVNLDLREDFKLVLRYAKLAGLMHRIAVGRDNSYRIELDGPASILQQTRRYGVMMAKFLPGLLSCKGWKLQATLKVQRHHSEMMLELDSESGLSSSVRPGVEFDSEIERHFANAWGTENRQQWKMIREGGILHKGQKAFVPDFSFEHASGKVAMLEIIGFWTPEYLKHKREVIELFRDHSVLYAIQEDALEAFRDCEEIVISYKTVLKVDAVLEKLQNHLLRMK